MGVLVRLSRVVVRIAAGRFVPRLVRRYPIVSVAVFVVRRWRRRATRDGRTTLTLRRGETVVITDREV